MVGRQWRTSNELTAVERVRVFGTQLLRNGLEFGSDIVEVEGRDVLGLGGGVHDGRLYIDFFHHQRYNQTSP